MCIRDRDEQREKLLAAVAAAQKFYVAELAKKGNPAVAYLDSRDVPESVAKALGVGYAPPGWENLAKGLGGSWPESVLVEAGLLQPRAEGRGAYDRFRNRLLFTIRDERGRPVGFSGRALSPEDEPKYLNSPESPIFLKKRLLYALTDARDASRRRLRRRPGRPERGAVRAHASARAGARGRRRPPSRGGGPRRRPAQR